MTANSLLGAVSMVAVFQIIQNGSIDVKATAKSPVRRLLEGIVAKERANSSPIADYP